MPEEPYQSNRPTLPHTVNIVMHVAHVLATLFTPFARRCFGKNYPGVYALGAILLALWFAGVKGDVILLYYTYTLIGMQAIRRIETFAVILSGRRRFHTLEGGDPWLGMRMPFVRTEVGARLMEPVICFSAATIAGHWSPTLQALLNASAVSLLLIEIVHRFREVRLRDAISDREIEMQWHMETLKRERP